MFSPLDHLEVNEIEVSLPNINKPHTPSGLSGGDWQQTLYIDRACRQSHVTDSWNVNNRWSTRLANNIINKNVRHILLYGYFFILSRSKMYYTVIS